MRAPDSKRWASRRRSGAGYPIDRWPAPDEPNGVQPQPRASKVAFQLGSFVHDVCDLGLSHLVVHLCQGGQPFLFVAQSLRHRQRRTAPAVLGLRLRQPFGPGDQLDQVRSYEIAKHWYSELIPELEHLIEKGLKDPKKADAAKALQIGLDKVLNSPEHRWYLGKMSPAEKAKRAERAQEFKNRYE